MTVEALRLQVDWLKLGGAPLLHTAGRVALSVCPGRPELGAGLEGDVADLVALRLGAVVSLVDEAEMRVYGVGGLAEALGGAGLRHIAFPMVDGLPPREMAAARALCRQVLGLLGEGVSVLLHCIGGWGRSGTIAACLLCHEGHSPRRAIELVRRARSPRCVETPAQELFVHKYAQIQRGLRRRYLFVPRQELGELLTGSPGDRRLTPGPKTRSVDAAEHLTRAIIQIQHGRAAEGFVVLSGEVAADGEAQAEIAIDRAYRISGTGLIPVPLAGA